MAVGGVGGGGASQIFQMLQLNKQLNEQAAQRSEQSREKAKATATAIIDQNIAGQQRSVQAGSTNLKLGQIVNTTA